MDLGGGRQDQRELASAPPGCRHPGRMGRKMNLLGFQDGVRVFIVRIGISGLVWFLGRAKNSNWTKIF